MSLFSGKVIIVTGAASGIGLAVVRKLTFEGATIALADINEQNLDRALNECGDGHFGRVFSVTSAEDVNHFVNDVATEFGQIDHVCNCAGVNPTPTPLEETTDEYWDKLVDTNLKGIFNVTRAAIPHLKSGASFVNVSSLLGLKGSAQNAVYSATKYGVIGFSKSMALELGPRGIRTNVVAPGFIDTPTNASILAGEESVKRAEQAVALRRMGQPAEVADVVAFLFSDESRYMNGSVVEINGGL